MGMYLNILPDGRPLPQRGKVHALMGFDEVNLLPKSPDTLIPDLVCVVDAGPYDAAAYVYDEREFQMIHNAIKSGDTRSMTWLTVPNAEKLVREFVPTELAEKTEAEKVPEVVVNAINMLVDRAMEDLKVDEDTVAVLRYGEDKDQVMQLKVDDIDKLNNVFVRATKRRPVAVCVACSLLSTPTMHLTGKTVEERAESLAVVREVLER